MQSAASSVLRTDGVSWGQLDVLRRKIPSDSTKDPGWGHLIVLEVVWHCCIEEDVVRSLPFHIFTIREEPQHCIPNQLIGKRAAQLGRAGNSGT